MVLVPALNAADIMCSIGYIKVGVDHIYFTVQVRGRTHRITPPHNWENDITRGSILKDPQLLQALGQKQAN